VENELQPKSVDPSQKETKWLAGPVRFLFTHFEPLNQAGELFRK
jgi:hypothetical protein